MRARVHVHNIFFFQLTLKYAIRYLQQRQYCGFLQCVVLIPLRASPHLFVVYFSFMVAASVRTRAAACGPLQMLQQ